MKSSSAKKRWKEKKNFRDDSNQPEKRRRNILNFYYKGVSIKVKGRSRENKLLFVFPSLITKLAQLSLINVGQ